MKIYIPTKGRSDRLETTKHLQRTDYDVTLIVCESEIEAYAKCGFNLKAVPDEWRIADIRQWVCYESGERYVCMIDDDLRFFTRDDIDYPDLTSVEDIAPLLRWVESTLLDYAHCSVSTREQNFQNSKNLEKFNSLYLETCRPYRFYGYDTDIIKGEGLSFHLGGVNNTMDDFHMTLNLMELGFMNLVNFKYAHNQKGSDTVGGASSYRTLETLKDCAIALQKAHPTVVKLVKKKTISSWGGTKENPVTRTDVIIQWKKSLSIRSKERKYDPSNV